MHIAEAFWPVVLACSLTFVVLRTGWFQKMQPLPPGDVLVFIERALQELRRMGCIWSAIRRTLDKMQRKLKVAYLRLLRVSMAALRVAENNFSRWSVAGLLVVTIALGMSLIASLPFNPLEWVQLIFQRHFFGP